jgi:hypothetical protein
MEMTIYFLKLNKFLAKKWILILFLTWKKKDYIFLTTFMYDTVLKINSKSLGNLKFILD